MNKMTQMFLGLLLVFSLTSCTTMMVGGGKSGTRFQTTVAKIYDASLDVLNDEKMPIVRKSLSENLAQVDSEYPDGTQVYITAKATSPQYSEAVVRIGTAGDDYRAYEIMKKIEARIK